MSVSPRDEEGAVEKLGMLQFEMDEAFPQASKILPTIQEPQHPALETVVKIPPE